MYIVPTGNFEGRDLLTFSHIPVLVFPQSLSEDGAAESELFSGLFPSVAGLMHLMHCPEVLRI